MWSLSNTPTWRGHDHDILQIDPSTSEDGGAQGRLKLELDSYEIKRRTKLRSNNGFPEGPSSRSRQDDSRNDLSTEPNFPSHDAACLPRTSNLSQVRPQRYAKKGKARKRSLEYYYYYYSVSKTLLLFYHFTFFRAPGDRVIVCSHVSLQGWQRSHVDDGLLHPERHWTCRSPGLFYALSKKRQALSLKRPVGAC